jgi:branched-chain amino acid transport system permease protein
MTDTLQLQSGTEAGAKPAIPLPASAARAVTAAGAVLTAASAFLAWTYSSQFPGDLTVNGYPGGLQWLTFTGGLLTLLYVLVGYRAPGLRFLAPGGPEGTTVILAVGAAATTWFTLIAISVELGGLANLTSGGWIAGIASLLAVVGALGLPRDGEQPQAHGLGLLLYPGKRPDLRPAKPLNRFVELLVVVLALAAALGIFAYGIDTAYAELFAGFLILAAFTAWAANRSGDFTRLGELMQRHRATAAVGAFIAAGLFPFTQNSANAEANANLGVSILIFAATALGLNIVVGLAGLLDLGYVAFLGVGAYTAALVSGAAGTAFHVQFPFWAAALLGAAVSGVFGVLLGAPTLRVRGDYLAIVTLGFGEIFRIVVQNLDGTSGPNVTNGAIGISNVPDLNVFGFDFGSSHSFGPFALGRFANYFELMLLFTAIIVLVFARSTNSRIGRAWIAIREDETAATAMGINGFRFKLLAFALGATLAGLAGTVFVHVNYSIVPDTFQFAGPTPPNSAFLLAAVVIGGMGTVTGPLVGASLFFLLQAKLSFLHDYQLLLFGITLILFMRFRPEGIIPNRRRQLEFHEAETEAGQEGPTAELRTAEA